MNIEEDVIITDKKERKKKNRALLFIVTFFAGIIFIAATYAWFSTSLDVRIRFVRMNVSSNSGLFISLDGIDFYDEVIVTVDSIINDLTPIYPTHSNQWAAAGLWPVSSNGIRNSNMDKFDFYAGFFSKTKHFYPSGERIRLLNTAILDESSPSALNSFISFDIFLKNDVGSPSTNNAIVDNLSFDEGTMIDFEEDVDDEIRENMQGLINSLRIGIVKMGSVPIISPVNTIQNIGCNGNCQAIIYEPFSNNHSVDSITRAYDYGIIMRDGFYTPTYGIIGEGLRMNHTNGHFGTGIPLDTEHFAFQNTIKDEYLDVTLFQLPHQTITKCRVYIWVEGQDIDSLEVYSLGAALEVAINLVKDMAGYDEYNG